MAKTVTQRAVARFLAADRQDLDKLHFIRRLVGLARDIGCGRPVSNEDREDALRIVVEQSPHRSWNKSRLSEARLVFDCYLTFDSVVAHLEGSGEPYTWHDVISALRKSRNGRLPATVKRRNAESLRTELSRIAQARGLVIDSIEQRTNRLMVTFIVKNGRARGE